MVPVVSEVQACFNGCLPWKKRFAIAIAPIVFTVKSAAVTGRCVITYWQPKKEDRAQPEPDAL